VPDDSVGKPRQRLTGFGVQQVELRLTEGMTANEQRDCAEISIPARRVGVFNILLPMQRAGREYDSIRPLPLLLHKSITGHQLTIRRSIRRTGIQALVESARFQAV
jgi:hypothetical protein